MADNLSPEALELKRRGRRRLIGAATLALLAVIVLPMIFDSEPKRTGKDTQEIAISIPAKDGLAPLPAAVPVKPAPGADAGQPAAAPQAAADAGKAPDAPPVATVASAKPETTPAPALVESKPAAKPEAPAKAESRREGFAVQLGAFSDPDNVKQLRAKITSARVPVYTEELKTAAGSSTRVRAGPYKTREQAERALQQVRKAGVDGKVVPLS